MKDKSVSTKLDISLVPGSPDLTDHCVSETNVHQSNLRETNEIPKGDTYDKCSFLIWYTIFDNP